MRDLLRILEARWPLAQVVILPVRVQGEEAAGEIAGALRWANENQIADLIITGRGGGSMEEMCIRDSALTEECDQGQYFCVKLKGLTFSLSGVENQVKALAERGERPEQIACYTLDTVANAVLAATRAAWEKWPGLPVLCSGGVASSRRLRRWMDGALFAAPEYSTDNAMGVAILTHRMLEKEGRA